MEDAFVAAVSLTANFAAIFLAAISAVMALRAEARNQQRFELQLSQSRDLAERNARPMLHVLQHSFDNEGVLLLLNDGAGVAVVTSLKCERAGESSRDLVDVLNLKTKCLGTKVPSWLTFFTSVPVRRWL